MDKNQRYLKTVRVRNFQSHRDTEVHFEPGINLIVGSSDVGKSALLRAINLAMHNEVPNREFVTYGAKNATVCLEFSDGTVIERVKGDEKNAKNSYYLTLPGAKTEEFERVGTEVPEPVRRALGFPPSDEHHGPLAYADQHSKLFLVNLTPTQLPRAISQLTGLDDFEDGAKELARQARQYDKQIKESAERVSRMEEQLGQYDGLDAQLRRLERYEKELESLEELSESLAEADELLEQYSEVMREGRAAKAAVDAAKAISAFCEPVEDMQREMVALDEALALISRHEEIASQERSARAAEEVARSVASPENIAHLEAIGKSIEELEEMMEHLEAYSEIMAEGRSAKASMVAAERDLAAAEAAETEFRSVLAARGALCDNCGQVLNV